MCSRTLIKRAPSNEPESTERGSSRLAKISGFEAGSRFTVVTESTAERRSRYAARVSPPRSITFPVSFGASAEIAASSWRRRMEKVISVVWRTSDSLARERRAAPALAQEVVLLALSLVEPKANGVDVEVVRLTGGLECGIEL